MKIVGIFDRSGPKYWRVLLPLHLMAGIDVIIRYKLMESDLADCDILFFNRSIPHKLETILALRSKYGFKLVCDFDDHYILGPDHPLYEQYREGNISERLKEWLINSDVVTVTHERLYREFLPLNKNIHILPNAIAQADQFNVKHIESKYTRLFWCGSPTHKNDLALLTSSFKKIDRRNVEFIMGGYDSRNPEWEGMVNAYTNYGKYKHNILNAEPVHLYYGMYAHCDIALIPLVENHFNAHKSNLKILEAANIGAPVIVSQVDPYLGFPDQVVNYVDGFNKTWYRQITKLLREPEWRKEQGQQLREYCRINYNFDSINKHRREVFEAVKHR